MTLFRALVALALVHVALGHGGHLHAWTWDTPGYNYIRYPAASCSNFQPVNASAIQTGPIPQFPAVNNGTVSITGSLGVWIYLDKNCSDGVTTTVIPSLTFTRGDGTPVAEGTSYGYAFTGNCSAPGDLYRNNVTLGDSNNNLLWWWTDGETNDSGYLTGSSPNIFVPRFPGQPSPMTSFVIVPNPADGQALCCNLEFNAPPPSMFYQQGSICKSPPPPRPPTPPSPPSPPKKHNKKPPPKKKNKNM